MKICKKCSQEHSFSSKILEATEMSLKSKISKTIAVYKMAYSIEVKMYELELYILIKFTNIRCLLKVLSCRTGTRQCHCT